MTPKRISIQEAVVKVLKCGTTTMNSGLKIIFMGVMVVLLLQYIQTAMESSSFIDESAKEALTVTTRVVAGIASFPMFIKFMSKIKPSQIDASFVLTAYIGTIALLPSNFKKIFIKA